LRYEESVEALEALSRLPIEPAQTVGLARARTLLSGVGNPHLGLRAVQVAGSSGKGSTATMIASVLQQSGLHIGLFRSPHLSAYTERMRIDGDDISRHDWASYFNRLWPIVERMCDPSTPEGAFGRPSFFEVVFAVSALYFVEADLEWVVLEAGMGGRLDATSTAVPRVAVVTNVSLEHTHVLGTTVQEIAHEKAAIIRSEAVAVTGAEGVALDVVRRRAREVRVELLEVPRHVNVRIMTRSTDAQTVELCCPEGHLTASLPSGGSYQAINAATAYATCIALRQRGLILPDDAVQRGLREARIPGRFEVISREPLVILDGAHNAAGAEALSQSLRSMATTERRVLVFSAMQDKNLAEMASSLGSAVDVAVVTSVPGTDRSADPTFIASLFDSGTVATIVEPDPTTALERALKMTSPADAVVIAGSLYLVGFAREALLSAGVR